MGSKNLRLIDLANIYRVILKEKYTAKPAHAVISIKQSPVLKGHLY